jgi:hypothetical protein
MRVRKLTLAVPVTTVVDWPPDRGKMDLELEERMAEYVRRRRPPPSHPYWDRLRDRAHPPLLVTPIAIPAVVGLGVGLYGGMRPPFTMGDAVRVASVGAAGLAGIVFVAATIILMVDAARQMPRHERWVAAVVLGLAMAAFFFFMAVIVLTLFLTWYSACSGEGPWHGMLIGMAIGATPAAFFAGTARQRWRARQRHWPKWERMRTPRRRAILNVNELGNPPADPATNVESATTDPTPTSPLPEPGKFTSE